MTVIIAPQDLESFAAKLLNAGGFHKSESEITAKSLVASNLVGHDSHGVIRIIEYLGDIKKGITRPNAILSIDSESPTHIHADGGYGLGPMIMEDLLARLHHKLIDGAVVCGSLQKCGHTGRLGYWAEWFTNHNLAGLIAVNDNGVLQFVAPPGSKQAATSTNPIAIGLPGGAEDRDFILDMSTSAAAIGKIRLDYMAGQPSKSGLLQDCEGRPTTDPAVMFEDPKGALLPMGGAQAYKGFGLSMAIDLLVAGLCGGFAPKAPDGTQLCNNVLVIGWNPSKFAGHDHFHQEIERYHDFLQTLEMSDPGKQIRLPGDRARKEREKRLSEGIPLTRPACERLVHKARKLSVEMPPPLREFQEI